MHTRSEPPERAAESGTNGGRDPVQRWRLVVRRAALAGDLAQREQLSAWESALIASGLPVAGLDAQKPKPRFAFAAPLGAAIPGEAELVDLWLVQRLPRWRVREALSGGLPAGFGLVDLYDVWLGEAPLPGRVAASVYRAGLGATADAERLAEAAAALLAASTLPRERRRGDGLVGYDLRPYLGALEVQHGSEGAVVVRMTLRHDPAKGVGRPDEALLALAEAAGAAPLETTWLVREGILLAAPPAPEPPGPRGARRPQPGRSAAPDSRPRTPRTADH